jgi:hypothetical protein
MMELGNILIKDRESFILLLRYADIPVSDTAMDSELIDAFIDNINRNRKLMIGTAFLINQKNKKIGFDGEEEVSDAGVKAVHKVMFNYFDAARPEYSNAIGGAWAGAIDSLAKVGSGAINLQNKKKFGAQDLLTKKMDAKQAMIDTVLEQRKAEQVAQQKKVAEKAKLKKILIISSVSLVGLALVVGGIYLYKRSKK